MTETPETTHAPTGVARAASDAGVAVPAELAPVPEPIVGLRTRAVYANPWISVREDVVRFPSGHEGIYGVVTCQPCVGVLPFLDHDHVLLVRQYRYVIAAPTWEMPTGARHDGESALDAVRRELAEETGWWPGRLRHLATIDSSKSVVDERAELFVAHDLTPATGHHPDLTESIITARVPFDDVVRMVRRSEITDAMTVAAVLHVALERAR